MVISVQVLWVKALNLEVTNISQTQSGPPCIFIAIAKLQREKKKKCPKLFR